MTQTVFTLGPSFPRTDKELWAIRDVGSQEDPDTDHPHLGCWHRPIRLPFPVSRGDLLYFIHTGLKREPGWYALKHMHEELVQQGKHLDAGYNHFREVGEVRAFDGAYVVTEMIDLMAPSQAPNVIRRQFLAFAAPQPFEPVEDPVAEAGRFARELGRMVRR